MTSAGKRSLHSPAVETVAGNGDLLSEILLRLPVRSLMRFESVSKKWLSLISDPHFAQDYTRRHNPNSDSSGLLLNHNYAGIQFIPFNQNGGDESRVRLSNPDCPGIMLLQSCNGLLLCSSVFFPYWKANLGGIRFFVCNPTTKKFSPLPFPCREFESSLINVVLVFDPLKSPHYKVIFIHEVNEESSTNRIDIYSSETRSLRPPVSGDPLTFTAPPGLSFGSPVYCNGAIHWYSAGRTSLYFDTDIERLKTMPIPPSDGGYVQYFGEFRGHLHQIMTYDPLDVEFDIWELKTDCSRWFIRYHVNLDAVIAALQGIAWNRRFLKFSVLCVAQAEKEEESTLVLFVAGKAISFSLNNDISKKLCDLVPCDKNEQYTLDYQCWDTFQYIETLFHV